MEIIEFGYNEKSTNEKMFHLQLYGRTTVSSEKQFQLFKYSFQEIFRNFQLV